MVVPGFSLPAEDVSQSEAGLRDWQPTQPKGCDYLLSDEREYRTPNNEQRMTKKMNHGSRRLLLRNWQQTQPEGCDCNRTLTLPTQPFASV